MTTARRPADALYALAELLRARGLTRLYGAACTALGVLSVASGITVWTNGQRLWWHERGEETGWPAADPEGAANQLAGLAAGHKSGQDTGPR